jgi:hypothetical protein
MKLNIAAFALTCAIFWGLGITWWLILREGPTGDLTLLGRIYPGYRLTYLGSLVGLGWGFLDGLIGGGVFAWLYNVLARPGTAEPQEG